MKLNFIRNTNWITAYIVVGVLAAVITLLISSLILPFKPYRLSCKELESKKISAGIRYSLYDDLNLDGISEKIILNRTTNGLTNPFIEILNADNRVIIKKKLKESWNYGNYFSGDFDNDSLKEFYVFTRKRQSYLHDSLFIYGINPFGGKPDLVNRAYVTSLDQYYKKTIKGKPWLFDLKILGMWDVDDDGYKDLVFFIKNTKSFVGTIKIKIYEKPNRLFAFSIKKQKIIAQTDDFRNNYDFNFFKIDSQNIGIYPTYEFVSDKKTQFGESLKNNYVFFILDKKFRYITKPTPIDTPYMSMIRFFPGDKNFNKFIGFQNHQYNTLFIVLNKNGQILKRFELNNIYVPVTKIMPPPNGKYVPILLKKHRLLYQLDSLYKPKPVFDYKNINIRNIFRMNVDSDDDLEILNVDLQKKINKRILSIIQDDFKNFSSIQLPGYTDLKNIIFSIKRGKGGKNLLSISSQNFDGLYLYGPNPFYHLNYLFMFLGFLLIFVILYAVFRVFNSLFFYYHFIARHLNSINKGVLLITFQGKIQHVNRNFVRMLNLQNIQQGMHVIKVFQPYPQILELVQKLLSGEKKEVNGEITLQRPEGTFKGRVFGYLLSGMAGIPSGYCVEIYDLSESILSDREEIIARLIRKMAHDIKTPLSTIKFAIEAMHYVLPDPEYQKVQQDVSTVVQEVNHIHAITDNYSKFARLSKLNLEVISIKDIINKVINSYEYWDSVKVKINITPHADMLTADGTQIELLIKELFENALDAVGKEGNITFETFPAYLGDGNNLEAILLRISDNGKGIAKEIKDRIFEPSFSTKNQGSGFGLVLAQRIVQNHGGKITIDSEQGKGTHVLVVLPKDMFEITEQKKDNDET